MPRRGCLLAFTRLGPAGPKFCHALTTTDSKSECITELEPGEQKEKTILWSPFQIIWLAYKSILSRDTHLQGPMMKLCSL